MIQLILLVGNEDIVGRNLLVDVQQLRAQQADLLIDDIFLSNHIGNFVFIFLVLFLNGLDFLLNISFLLLQVVDLIADLRRGLGAGSGGNQARNQRQQHYRRHKTCQNGHKALILVHENLLCECGGISKCMPRGLHKFLHKKCQSADGAPWSRRCCPHNQ